MEEKINNTDRKGIHKSRFEPESYSKIMSKTTSKIANNLLTQKLNRLKENKNTVISLDDDFEFDINTLEIFNIENSYDLKSNSPECLGCGGYFLTIDDAVYCSNYCISFNINSLYQNQLTMNDFLLLFINAIKNHKNSNCNQLKWIVLDNPFTIECLSCINNLLSNFN